MQKVFSSNEVTETVLVRDALVQQGIEVTIQNRHSGRSAVPGFRPAAEIWLRNVEDYDRARQIVVDTLATLDQKTEAAPWVCAGCGEENPQSFDFCWSCGHSRKGGSGDD
ncbi:MAG: DUF7577 domain-containing protein [Gammaproteobacteria bacterium]